jgi:hypothetical protein
LIEDIGESLEGYFEFVIKADSADEVEELESKVSQNFDGGKNEVDCESAHM